MEVKDDRILRFPQVIQKTGLSRSSVYGRIKSGEFPTPIPLGSGRAIGFLERDVAAWIEGVALRASPHGERSIQKECTS